MTDQDRIKLFPIFRFFSFAHLPPHLQKISKPFHDLAVLMIEASDNTGLAWEEKNAGLRKLLEAKDCFVRSGIKQETVQPSPTVDKPFPSVFYKILMANELGNDPSLILKFSDPDGVRTGKSGYSFGVSQFDLKNNPSAVRCLKDCGFSQNEIEDLVNQPSISDTRLEYYNSKLASSSDKVEQFDLDHMQQSLDHVGKLCNALAGIHLQDMETFYHIADYHNQSYLTPDGKLHSYLKSYTGTITPETIS